MTRDSTYLENTWYIFQTWRAYLRVDGWVDSTELYNVGVQNYLNFNKASLKNRVPCFWYLPIMSRNPQTIFLSSLNTENPKWFPLCQDKLFLETVQRMCSGKYTLLENKAWLHEPLPWPFVGRKVMRFGGVWWRERKSSYSLWGNMHISQKATHKPGCHFQLTWDALAWVTCAYSNPSHWCSENKLAKIERNFLSSFACPVFVSSWV